jgi:hypothetical protein
MKTTVICDDVRCSMVETDRDLINVCSIRRMQAVNTGACCQFVKRGSNQQAPPHHLCVTHCNDSYIWHKAIYSLYNIMLRAKVQVPFTFGICKYGGENMPIFLFLHWCIACII